MDLNDVAAALRQAKGLVSVAARLLRVDRTALHHRIARSPRLQAILAEQREVVLDLAEGKLYQRVAAGDLQAIMFTLRTLGRSRGFTERVEHEHGGQDGRPIEFTMDLNAGRQSPLPRALPPAASDE